MVNSSDLREPRTFSILEKIGLVFSVILVLLFVYLMWGPRLCCGGLNAKDSRRAADLRLVQNVLELYFNKVGSYPVSQNWEALKNAIVDADVGIKYIPRDPESVNPNYVYSTNVARDSYVLRAVLNQDKAELLLIDDIDGNVFGVDCEDGDGKNYYCVQPK